MSLSWNVRTTRSKARQQRSRNAFRLAVESLENRWLLDASGFAEPDVPYGFPQEFVAQNSQPIPYPNYSTKTLPAQEQADGLSDTLTFVLDFKESSQANTSDIFGNEVSTFDVTSYGFTAGDYNTVVDAVMAEVNKDYFTELVGTVAGPTGQQLDVQFITGDIGVAPVGITEYYYIQIGTIVAGPNNNGTLGVAGGSVVRDSAGVGPNFGVETGDVVGSMFTNAIQSLGSLSPSDALSSGNVGFTKFAVSGTLSHEIGHALSLSHITKAGSTQPTGLPPIMGTGAIDLPNQDRIGNREFSLSGVDGQDGNAARAHIQQLKDALGLASTTTDDYGNDAATAHLVSVPSTTSGNLEVASDNDFFKFNATAGYIYTWETTAGTLLDTTLSLKDTDGVTELAFNDDEGVGNASLITWTAPADGTYFLDLRDFDNDDAGTYSLAGSVVIPDDHGDDALTATLVNVPSTTAGNLEEASDNDFFKFNATAGSIYTWETTAGTLLDTTLSLKDTDGVTELAFNDDEGVDTASLITWTAPASGTYFLDLRDFDNDDAGTYSLAGSVVVPNSPPVIGNFGGPLAFRENQGQRTLGNVATLIDSSPDFDTGVLAATIAAGGNANDRLEIRDRTGTPNRIGLTGADVTYNGIVIGTFAGGTGTTPLTVQLNSAATQPIVQTLLRSLTFRTLGDSPSTVARTINFVVTDGDGGTSNTATKSVTVEAINDRPVLALGGTATYTENQAARILATTTTVSDPDSPNFATGSLTVRVSQNSNANDRLGIAHQGTGAGQIGVSGTNVSFAGNTIGSFSGGSGNASLVVSLNASATIATVQALTQAITFRSLGENPSTLQRTVSWQLNDGDGSVSAIATKLVNVVALNDAPAINGTGSTLGYTRNSPALLFSNAFTLADPDSANFATGRLLVKVDSGASATNRLEVGGAFSLASNTVNYFNGTTTVAIGTRNANGGVGTVNLFINFNANATYSIASQLLRNIRFRTEALAAGPQVTRVVSLNITDGDGGTSNSVTRTINVN